MSRSCIQICYMRFMATCIKTTILKKRCMVVYYYCIFPTYNLYASCQSQICCRDSYALHTPHAAVLMPFAGGNNAGKWAQSLQECKTPPSMYAPLALLPSSTGTGGETGHSRQNARQLSLAEILEHKDILNLMFREGDLRQLTRL